MLKKKKGKRNPSIAMWSCWSRSNYGLDVKPLGSLDEVVIKWGGKEVKPNWLIKWWQMLSP